MPAIADRLTSARVASLLRSLHAEHDRGEAPGPRPGGRSRRLKDDVVDVAAEPVKAKNSSRTAKVPQGEEVSCIKRLSGNSIALKFVERRLRRVTEA